MSHRIVLACLSGRDIDVDAIPDQEPLHAEGAKNAETIRLADPVKASETTVSRCLTTHQCWFHSSMTIRFV